MSMPDAMILGEDNPAALSNIREPDRPPDVQLVIPRTMIVHHRRTLPLAGYGTVGDLMGYKHIVTINSGNHVGRLCFRRMRAEHTRAKQLRWVLSCLVCRAE
jgi:hypothetical protein